MTTETEQNETGLGAPPSAQAPAKKKAASKKKSSVSVSELKRQLSEARAKLAASNEENEVLHDLVETQTSILDSAAGGIGPGDQIASVHVSLLSDRWTKLEVVSGPSYVLDALTVDESAGTITEIPQDDDEILYEARVGKKAAYFSDIEDAGLQAEAWADVGSLRSYKAQDNPIDISRFLDAQDHDIRQSETREMQSTGDARDALSSNVHVETEMGFQVVGTKEKADMLAFMEQELEVMVHDSNNPQDVPIPMFQNDGRSQYFIRGKTQTVKRKFVEILARCKQTTFSNQLYQDAAGADAYRYPSHTALMFPFSIISDPHPRGRDWLKTVLNEEQ